jgi:serine/threonine-protein kinase
MVGEYVIYGTIAHGGGGIIYAAEHRMLGRRVAIKVLHGHMVKFGEMLERFIREARAPSMIGHPNIVDVFDFGRLEDDRPYYVMELLDGVGLDQLLKQQGRLDEEEALSLLGPICAALEATHAAGFVHRDLKAANIMVVGRGTQRTVKLLDYGIAKVLLPRGKSHSTTAGRRMGTPRSMAPEQIAGKKVDRRADIYGLGVLAFQMLTGKPPFDGDSPEEIERLHLEATPPHPSVIAPISEALGDAILQALEKDPGRRYQSAKDFWNAIRGASASGLLRDPGTRTSRALGVYIETRIGGEGAGDDIEGYTLDDVDNVLALSRQLLRRAGLHVAIQTGSAILGIGEVPADSASVDAGCRRTVQLGRALLHALESRGDRDERVHANITLHIDRISVRTSAHGGPEFRGPLLATTAWASARTVPGLCLTKDFLQGLLEKPTARSLGSVFVVDAST